MFFKLFWYNVVVHWKLKLLNFQVDSILMLSVPQSTVVHWNNTYFWLGIVCWQSLIQALTHVQLKIYIHVVMLFFNRGGHLTGRGPGFVGQDTSQVGQKKEKRKREWQTRPSFCPSKSEICWSFDRWLAVICRLVVPKEEFDHSLHLCCGSILFLVQILFPFVFGYGNVW